MIYKLKTTKMRWVLILIAFISFSCVSQRKVVYFQGDSKKQDYKSLRQEILIKPFDQLYINVTSLDQQGYNFFLQDKGGGYNVTTELLSVISYTVNDSGFVKLPYLGKLKLGGLTLDQAEKNIESSYRNYLNNPLVNVRFVNTVVTVLGQVSRPGTYMFSTQQINIFNALGIAGDITEYGNRKKVVLIREEKNKEIKKYTLNLTKDDILQSDNLFVRSNDIIYVEPLRHRYWGMQRFPFEIILSSVTTAVLVLSYVKR